MKGAEVRFNTGDVLRTSINGTDAEIKNYYKKGKWFNLGGKYDPTKDRMAKVVSCKVLKDDNVKKRGTWSMKGKSDSKTKSKSICKAMVHGKFGMHPCTKPAVIGRKWCTIHLKYG